MLSLDIFGVTFCLAAVYIALLCERASGPVFRQQNAGLALMKWKTLGLRPSISWRVDSGDHAGCSSCCTVALIRLQRP